MMSNEELEKALEVTQEAVKELSSLCGKMAGMLKNSGVLNDLDISYLKGDISDDEYKKQYREQHDLYKQIMSIFNAPIPESPDKTCGEDADK